MVNVWVEAIISGKRNFNQTPAKLKDAVREELVARGHESLVVE